MKPTVPGGEFKIRCISFGSQRRFLFFFFSKKISNNFGNPCGFDGLNLDCPAFRC